MSLAHGVRWRAVYAPEALEIPGALEEITELARRGERGRVLPGLPLKLAIADARVALLPLSLDLETTQVTLIQESTLLDALVDLFQRYWDSRCPSATTPVRCGRSTRRRGSWACRPGPLRRRMRTLLDELSTTNRFHVGIQAARHGWLGRPATRHTSPADPSGPPRDGHRNLVWLGATTTTR